MNSIFKSACLITFITFLGCRAPTDSTSRIEKAEKQLTGLRELAMKAQNIPRSAENDSVRWIATPYDWTEGFWPGTCWMLYETTGNEKWKQAAIASQKIYIAHKNLTTDHDLGFIFNNSYGKAYRITGQEEYKQVLLDASNSLITRFNKNVGCIQSWDVTSGWQSERGWQFPVIIDNLMNLEMLFEASRITGDRRYRDIAITHANTTMRNHFRQDGSSYHVVDYNPDTGEIAGRVTAQGFADESAWARGQAWGLYAYTMCYRYTNDKKYLDFAEKIAHFILNHPNYPEDGVPYWDFNAPNIPNEKRDASAGAIIASALAELNRYTNDKYLKNVQCIMDTLSGDVFMARRGENGHFVLMHSVGSIPHGNEIDVPLNYADYYYIEALMRLHEKAL